MPPKRSIEVVVEIKSAPGKKAKLTKVYCHQDHQAHDPSTTTLLRCTTPKPLLKSAAKGSAPLTCRHTYCSRCLLNRYGIAADEVVQAGKQGEWKCPSCCGNCNCSVCRRHATGSLRHAPQLTLKLYRKSNQLPTGSLTALTKSRGLSNAAELLAQDAVASTSFSTPKPSTKSPKQRTTIIVGPFPSTSKNIPARWFSPASPPASTSKPTPSPLGAIKDFSSTVSLASIKPTASHSPPKPKAKVPTPTLPIASSSTLSPSKRPVVPYPQPRSASHPRKATATPPLYVPAPIAKPTRGPRAPPPIKPPPSHPLTSTGIPTSLLLTRLNTRSFLLRFAALLPSLQSSTDPNRKLARRAVVSLKWLEGIEEDVLERDGAWGVEGEDAQRGCVEGLLLLLRGEREEEEEMDAESEEEQSDEEMEDLGDEGDVDRVLAEVRKAGSAASLKAKRKYWAEVGEFIGTGKNGAEVKEWREWIGKPKSQVEVDGAERMRCLAGLVELAYESDEVRESMAEGRVEEKAKKVELNKQKFKARAELVERKKMLSASRPTEPIASPAKRGLAAKEAARASWRKELRLVDAKIAQAIRAEQVIQTQILHDLHLSTATHHTRFLAGTDTLGNNYYLLPSTPHATHPTFDDNEPWPLSWSILVHGTPFASPKPSKLTTSTPAVPSSEPLSKWFLVNNPGQLADYIEWGRKTAVFEGRGDEVVEVAELVGALRAFEAYCEVERETAEKGEE